MEVDGDPPAPSPTDGRRLMIREMVLDNFKSYAGPQHVGPFHKVQLDPAGSSTFMLTAGAVGSRCVLVPPLHAVLLLRGGTQWQWQEQRHRRHALCVWAAGQAGTLQPVPQPSWAYLHLSSASSCHYHHNATCCHTQHVTLSRPGPMDGTSPQQLGGLC